MRLSGLVFGAAALTLVAAPAAAQDPFNWTGGYIGGHAGIGRGAIDNGGTCDDGGQIPIHFLIEEPFDDLDWGDPCRWTLGGVGYGAFGPQGSHPNVGEPTGIRGFLGGAQIGYNLQLGGGNVGFVIGGEVAHSWTSLISRLDAEHWARGISIDWQSEFRINHVTTATLRAGVGFNRVMIYGEGGLALVNATWTNTLGFNDTATDHGYVFGAGIEAMIAERVSLFFEWNRIVIPEHDFLGEINFFVPLPTGVRVSSRTDIFKIGFNIALGGP
jgi:opacity protein-like surface antigen